MVDMSAILSVYSYIKKKSVRRWIKEQVDRFEIMLRDSERSESKSPFRERGFRG